MLLISASGLLSALAMQTRSTCSAELHLFASILTSVGFRRDVGLRPGA